jgi:hypothetical protein
MGIPPSHRTIPPNGFRKSGCFPIHEILAPNIKRAAIPKTKSQLDVCGPIIITNLGILGNLFLKPHPNIANINLPIHRKK